MNGPDESMVNALATFSRRELAAIRPVGPMECIAWQNVRDALETIQELTGRAKKGRASAVPRTPSSEEGTQRGQAYHIEGCL